MPTSPAARALLAVVSPFMASGTTDAELERLADRLAQEPAAIGEALRLLSRADRQIVAAKLVRRGVDARLFVGALAGPDDYSATDWALIAIHMASMGASTYHGYRRNRGSVGWAVVWGLLGGLFPIITPAVAIAQGFGKPAGKG